MKKSILIVDDHAVVRMGLEILLKDENEELDIREAENFAECLKKIAVQKFDLIILDIHLPDGIKTDMIQAIRAIQNSKILIFSAHEETEVAVKYLNVGANGYVSKLMEERKIVDAVKSILSGNNFFDKKVLDYTKNNEIIVVEDKLSSRELDVAKLLVHGYGNLEISNELQIKMSTVSTYKARIFEKLKVSNTIELASLFKDY